jgi:hypothetical protein
VSDQTIFQKTINLQEDIDVVDADFDLFHYDRQYVVVDIGTDNFEIVNHQLTVEKIILDDFYSKKQLTCLAKKMFDKLFLQYTDKNKIFLDWNNNNNCLNFTGKLSYQLTWPFYKNIIS